jgi:hypothetical protein
MALLYNSCPIKHTTHATDIWPFLTMPIRRHGKTRLPILGGLPVGATSGRRAGRNVTTRLQSGQLMWGSDPVGNSPAGFQSDQLMQGSGIRGILPAGLQSGRPVRGSSQRSNLLARLQPGQPVWESSPRSNLPARLHPGQSVEGSSPRRS